MFRIRRVYDNLVPANKDAIKQVQQILALQFPGVDKRDVAKLPRQLLNPLKYRFRAILFVAEDSKEKIRGFALLFHEPILKFCYLDYLSVGEKETGRGVGGALYERVREEALYLGSIGLFFECLPDDPRLSANPEIRKQNAARLRFYERYGARPFVNTDYETPLEPGGENPPYLLFDDLGQGVPLSRDRAHSIVRTILERKYGKVCPPGYIDMVVESFRDDPVKVRPRKYIKKKEYLPVNTSIPLDKKIILIVNDQHGIHHVEERGYVESPVRIETILRELDSTSLFHRITPKYFGERYIKAVHDGRFIDYLKKVCGNLQPDQALYPYVFPVRNVTRPPKELSVRAGYYCIDTFTPITRNVYLAAKKAVDCTLTAAKWIHEGYRLAYALVRPPGHHAERRSFGGFCYLNSLAIAAEYLSFRGSVAVVDIDYHHGNGQQDIFYERSDVLTISIHGHPNFTYPYFSGFEDEKGIGQGKGFNINVPLPENIDGERYLEVVGSVLKRVIKFQPTYLIVALGLDTAKEDPTGTWNLLARDFEAIGRIIGKLSIPTLVVQEGGYDTRVLGINARSFLTGLWEGSYAVK